MSTEVFDFRDFFDELRVIWSAYINSCLDRRNGWVALVDVDGMDGVAIDFTDVKVSGGMLHR